MERVDGARSDQRKKMERRQQKRAEILEEIKDGADRMQKLAKEHGIGPTGAPKIKIPTII